MLVYTKMYTLFALYHLDIEFIKSCINTESDCVYIVGNNIVTPPHSNELIIKISPDKSIDPDISKPQLTFSTFSACDQYISIQFPLYKRIVVDNNHLMHEYLKVELIGNAFIPKGCKLKDNLLKQGFIISKEIVNMCHLTRFNNEEQALLNVMNEIVTSGFNIPSRSNINTRTVFGKMFEYRMVEKINKETGQSMYRIPLLTTKRMFTRGVFEELMWFMNGKVDSKELERSRINIWKGNTSRTFLDSSGLNDYDEGETGPIYGFQWRHWGAEYKPKKKNYMNEGIDQIDNVIKSLKEDPFSRRHIISGWNVEDLDKMCLPPCFVSGTKVITKNGYKSIEQLTDSDLVMTHISNWKPIINRQSRLYEGSIHTIMHKACHNELVTTDEHPFLTKSILPNGTLGSETQWTKARDLNSDKHVLCIPISKSNVSIDIDWFFTGLYISSDVSEPMDHHWLSEFSIDESEVCNTIPEWIQDSNIENLKLLIDGFESCSQFNESKRVVNLNVALSLQRIYAKIGIVSIITKGINHSIYIKRVQSSSTFYIDDQYMYIPLKNVSTKLDTIQVYNIEVADDNSYVVENIATHNCHVLYQFMVHDEDGQKYLSLMMTQRSCDTFLGLPFNLCSLGMFLFLMARSVNMKPYKIIHSIANMHIYETHVDAVKRQLKNEPYAFPYIQMKSDDIPIKKIEDYVFDDIAIKQYYSHNRIQGDMIA